MDKITETSHFLCWQHCVIMGSTHSSISGRSTNLYGHKISVKVHQEDGNWSTLVFSYTTLGQMHTTNTTNEVFLKYTSKSSVYLFCPLSLKKKNLMPFWTAKNLKVHLPCDPAISYTSVYEHKGLQVNLSGMGFYNIRKALNWFLKGLAKNYFCWRDFFLFLEPQLLRSYTVPEVRR